MKKPKVKLAEDVDISKIPQITRKSNFHNYVDTYPFFEGDWGFSGCQPPDEYIYCCCVYPHNDKHMSFRGSLLLVLKTKDHVIGTNLHTSHTNRDIGLKVGDIVLIHFNESHWLLHDHETGYEKNQFLALSWNLYDTTKTERIEVAESITQAILDATESGRLLG